jgi:uncharacterized protein (TIGR02444 family)
MASLRGLRQQKMNAGTDHPTASDEFWSFSLAFYERPGVAAALLALQDGANLNVNLVLFAIWHGLSGRGRLDTSLLAAAQSVIHPLEHEVIGPLRALRRRLKSRNDADIGRLRERIKQLEIEAEQAAQIRLAAIAGPVLRADPAACLADAEANIAVILGSVEAPAQPATIIRRELQRLARIGVAALRPA